MTESKKPEIKNGAISLSQEYMYDALEVPKNIVLITNGYPVLVKNVVTCVDKTEGSMIFTKTPYIWYSEKNDLLFFHWHWKSKPPVSQFDVSPVINSTEKSLSYVKLDVSDAVYIGKFL
jgi:hypothetical protein